uniref:Uncharacterized protein n=1 Tax=Anthurium amnicola TaxID=1678845 RepID=A0A1D1XWX5_9ARAE
MASASWECTLDYADVERVDLPEIDCALLSTLLDDSHAEEDGALHTANAGSAPHAGGDREDCVLEGMASEARHDEDHSSGWTRMQMQVEDDEYSFGWADMDALAVGSSPCSDDMGEWLMATGEVGMVDYQDSHEYQLLYSSYYSFGDEPVEVDGYSPLWQ